MWSFQLREATRVMHQYTVLRLQTAHKELWDVTRSVVCVCVSFLVDTVLWLHTVMASGETGLRGRGNSCIFLYNYLWVRNFTALVVTIRKYLHFTLQECSKYRAPWHQASSPLSFRVRLYSNNFMWWLSQLLTNPVASKESKPNIPVTKGALSFSKIP